MTIVWEWLLARLASIQCTTTMNEAHENPRCALHRYSMEAVISQKIIVPPIKAHYQMGMLRLGTHLTVK